jgi:hypothetical protein
MCNGKCTNSCSDCNTKLPTGKKGKDGKDGANGSGGASTATQLIMDGVNKGCLVFEGDKLSDYTAALINAYCTLKAEVDVLEEIINSGGGTGMTPIVESGFQAKLTVEQTAGGGGADTSLFTSSVTSMEDFIGMSVGSALTNSYKIKFQDDFTGPIYYDNGDNFLLHTYTAPADGTYKFFLENIQGIFEFETLEGVDLARMAFVKEAIGGTQTIVAISATTAKETNTINYLEGIAHTISLLAGEKIFAIPIAKSGEFAILNFTFAKIKGYKM